MKYTPSIQLDNGLTIAREATGSIWFVYLKVKMVRVRHPRDIGCRETRTVAIRFLQTVIYSVNARGEFHITAHEFNRIATALGAECVGS